MKGPEGQRLGPKGKPLDAPEAPAIAKVPTPSTPPGLRGDDEEELTERSKIMKITKQQLKQIIMEELEVALNEKKLEFDPDAADIYIDKTPRGPMDIKRQLDDYTRQRTGTQDTDATEFTKSDMSQKYKNPADKKHDIDSTDIQASFGAHDFGSGVATSPVLGQERWRKTDLPMQRTGVAAKIFGQDKRSKQIQQYTATDPSGESTTTTSVDGKELKPWQKRKQRQATSALDRAEKTIRDPAASEYSAEKGWKVQKEHLKQIINEELTRDDKSEIKKMVDKQVEKMLKSELKKALEEELTKALKSKDVKEDVGEIAKTVIKKLYKDLSFHHPYIIDRIKI